MKAYQLLIKLLDIEPAVWRRVIIPAETTFKRLHDTIQLAMGWQNYHLYEFEIDVPNKVYKLQIVGNEETYNEHNFMQKEFLRNPPAEDDPFANYRSRIMAIEMKKAQTTKLPRLIEKYPKFLYMYDYGDGWQHSITLEMIVEDYSFGYPQLVDGLGNCPPEDVGGLGGYEEFLKAWNDPDHPDHEHILTWGKSQFYQDLDVENTNKLMREFLKLKKI